MFFAGGRLSKTVEVAVEKIIREALHNTESQLEKIRSLASLEVEIRELQTKREELLIEKNRKEEEWTRREREIEHKIGLERKRQEFEITQARREALVSVREENLKADRERFEGQLDFHEKRFTEEVGYLKDMIGSMLERLPEVKVSKRG